MTGVNRFDPLKKVVSTGIDGLDLFLVHLGYQRVQKNLNSLSKEFVLGHCVF